MAFWGDILMNWRISCEARVSNYNWTFYHSTRYPLLLSGQGQHGTSSLPGTSTYDLQFESNPRASICPSVYPHCHTLLRIPSAQPDSITSRWRLHLFSWIINEWEDWVWLFPENPSLSGTFLTVIHISMLRSRISVIFHVFDRSFILIKPDDFIM